MKRILIAAQLLISFQLLAQTHQETANFHAEARYNYNFNCADTLVFFPTGGCKIDVYVNDGHFTDYYYPMITMGEGYGYLINEPGIYVVKAILAGGTDCTNSTPEDYVLYEHSFTFSESLCSPQLIVSSQTLPTGSDCQNGSFIIHSRRDCHNDCVDDHSITIEVWKNNSLIKNESFSESNQPPCSQQLNDDTQEPILVTDLLNGTYTVKAYYTNAPECHTEKIVELFRYFRDNDGDGYGDPEHGIVGCLNPPDNSVDNNQDCRDDNPSINPNTEWYRDSDGDSFGDAAHMLRRCEEPEGFVINKEDCDDNNISVHPGAREMPWDRIDRNCSGTTSFSFIIISLLIFLVASVGVGALVARRKKIRH